MALAATPTRRSVPGDQYVVQGTVAFDASYPTGGEAFTLNQLGLTRLDDMYVFPFNGFTFKVDKPNLKILAYASSGTEVTNTTDLSALAAVQYLAFGA